MTLSLLRPCLAAALACGIAHADDSKADDSKLVKLPYNNPGLTVDLGVGLWAWPLPMDYDGDGDLDLVVSCPDKPSNGTYFFENPGAEPGEKLPVFKPGVRIAKGHTNIQISYIGGKPRVLIPAAEILNLTAATNTDPAAQLPKPIHDTPFVHPFEKVRKIRANQWRYVDFDGDGAVDLVVGVEDWEQYGWDDAYDANGNWTNGPLHGYVYLLRNVGNLEHPKCAEPVKVQAGGGPIDGFGMPSPSFADFDADGDLDLLCGEFLDGFTYYENVGSRTKPDYAAGRRLGVRMDLEMITPVAIDWDGDGDSDLICGDEDGRVALIEHTGKVENGTPVFAPPAYFRQEAAFVKFGALVSPFGCDWDGDGDGDLVCGNTAGYVGFVENLGPAENGLPKWAEPVRLQADGKTIRVIAGPNGSIQGPAEAKWGYSTLGVADWDGDGFADLIVNGIWGNPVWYRNVGSKTAPKLAAAQPIEVDWEGAARYPAWNWWRPRGDELATQWRTTPFATDWNADGLADLVMLDHEGYLAFFERAKRGDGRVLLAGKRVFADESSKPLKLSKGDAGKSGRRKLCLADWDRDGRTDLLIDGKNIDFYRNAGESGGVVTLVDAGPVDPHVLAGHDTSPAVVDWDRNGVPDLVIGAEDGFLYYLPNPH